MQLHKIACIGDSITFAYEICDAQKWTTLLSHALNIEVINYGVNGDTTAGMLSRFEQVLSTHKPTHIIITGGTNDLWFGLKDELIISNIFAMCRQAKHNNIIPIVGIPTSSFSLNELNFIGEDYAECIRSFQNILIRFCVDKELAYVDFSTNLQKEHFMEDGLHPNIKGQNIMIENAKRALNKLFND